MQNFALLVANFPTRHQSLPSDSGLNRKRRTPGQNHKQASAVSDEVGGCAALCRRPCSNQPALDEQLVSFSSIMRVTASWVAMRARDAEPKVCKQIVQGRKILSEKFSLTSDQVSKVSETIERSEIRHTSSHLGGWLLGIGQMLASFQSSGKTWHRIDELKMNRSDSLRWVMMMMFYFLLQQTSTSINIGLTLDVPSFKMSMEIWIIVVAIEAKLQKLGTNALRKQKHSPAKQSQCGLETFEEK